MRKIEKAVAKSKASAQKYSYRPAKYDASTTLRVGFLHDMYGEGAVACPTCGGGNLHQKYPAVSKEGDITLDFWCETCEALPRMIITQYKGTTYLSWMAQIVDDEEKI